ncbi:F-box only protein 48 [Xyrauchen texanus]|uniref:F-box only protein 48 n=1 Tax=Xyrauchen texanus TaxID=154827 RepID=UPI00224299D9|nr:F-box only protein 48 [Xyrauchen texanus]XP_051983616.1 F-box only protein 48 [Xyrauchen texanus]XP_051983617.1 F-box only protein 48 [Xyrauchen texanus]
MHKVCKRSNSAIFIQEGGSTMILGQNPLQQNFAETLPAEMSVRIFSELDLRSLCQASLTCKQWNGIIENSDLLWRSHCLTVLAICRGEVDGDRLDGYSWKVTLVRNYRKGCVKRRWLKGRYSNIRSADEIPSNSMCPLDVETWGEILEAELER